MTTHHHPVQFEQAPDGEIVVNVPNCRFKLMRGQKGSYGWEIACAGDDDTEVMQRVYDIDLHARKLYGSTDKTAD